MVSSKNILDFPESSRKLFVRFNSVHVRVLNTKKLNCRNFCFRLLGYGKVFSSRENDRDLNLEIWRILQVKNGHRKLHKPNNFDRGYNFWWRSSLFKDSCAKNMKEKQKLPRHLVNVDDLCSFKKACLVCQKYFSSKGGELGQIDVLRLDRSCLFINDAMASTRFLVLIQNRLCRKNKKKVFNHSHKWK